MSHFIHIKNVVLNVLIKMKTRIYAAPAVKGLISITAGPDRSFDTAVARHSEVLGSNRGRVGYLSSRL